MFELSEKELKEIFEKACKDAPEDLLEFSMLLSGKCRICDYIFPAPALGTYILLHEWKSPFEGDKNKAKEKGKKRAENILLEDLYMALYILENGRSAADVLMEKRMEKFFRKGKKEDSNTISLPYTILSKMKRKYNFSDPVSAAEQLEKILSLHSAIDMLPDEWNGEKTGEFVKKLEKKEYSSWMENIFGLVFAFQEFMPFLSVDEILWQTPFARLGFLLVRQCRKNNVSGIGKESVSRNLWQEFSRKLEEKKKKYEEKTKEEDNEND